MDKPALVDLYARYRSTVWERSLAEARRALGRRADPRDLRRAACRRHARRCLSYAAWCARRPSDASYALVGRSAAPA